MSSETLGYRVLLYYKYVTIEDHEAYTAAHLRFCKEIGILGRILIAREGINGTLSGTIEQTEAYMAHMRQDPRFADMQYKIDEVAGHAFKKIFVRARNEIVTFRLPYELDPNEITGKYLKPKEWKEMMDRDDVVIVDARTDYEYDLGHFKNAIRPDGVTSFREFPEWVRTHLSEFKNKPILAYCTGGIRCEKFTGFLMKEGFSDVYHLEGGIVTYGKDLEVNGEGFEGKCYVFDERIAVPVGENKVAGHCRYCDRLWDTYENCANLSCRTQVLVCPDCEAAHRRSCSESCKTAETNIYPYKTKKDYLQALSRIEVAKAKAKKASSLEAAS